MSTFLHTDTVELPATDRDALTRLERFGGIRLLDEMIGLFLGIAPERLAAAAAGLDQGDAVATENAMHALKSSSAQLGALRLSRLAEVEVAWVVREWAAVLDFRAGFMAASARRQ